MNVLISKQVFIVGGGIYCINQHKQMQLVVYSVCACVYMYCMYMHVCKCLCVSRQFTFTDVS